jgi:type II secretory pathway component PulF
VEGSVEANDKRLAMLMLERKGLVPVSVMEAHAAGEKSRKDKKKAKSKINFQLGFKRRSKMKTRELLLFTGELSDLIASGMKLGNALNTLSRRDNEAGQGEIIKSLRDDIVQGSSLSEALEKWPETFSALYISLVRAGEASGALAEALVQLRNHLERVSEAREKVMMALIYPAIILTMGSGTLIFAMVFVVPRFTAIFAELGSSLPLPTQILVSLSNFMGGPGGLILLGAIIGLIVLFQRSIKTEKGRIVWDRMQLRMPLVKQIVAANSYAHFARTLGALLENGVDVLKALTIVEDTVGNTHIAAAIRDARERVTDGSSISGPLAAGKVFPGLLTDMLAVGEQTGDMAGALKHIARRYDGELDRNVKVLTTLLEPILMVSMAVIVGFVAISMLMAVFDLTSGLNV